jgi:K+-transporting ATPase ATPase B chain
MSTPSASRQISILSPAMLGRAGVDALGKLDPRVQAKNPVMLVVFLGALWTTGAGAVGVARGGFPWFDLQIALWLWFTVLFANFAEAVAEGRGGAGGRLRGCGATRS